MRVAAVSWAIKPIASERDFWQRITSVCEEAARLGVQHLVFPELIVLELASLFPELEGPALVHRLAEFHDGFMELGMLAERFGISIVAGSHFVERDGKVWNVSASFFGDGHDVVQPKNVMTQFESGDWGITPGNLLRPKPPHGTLICYDSEFPEAGRAMAEAGVLCLNIPAFTETRRGFQRVRWCAQARAIENQIFVVHASLVGSLGREPVPSTYGTSAILCPSVAPFLESAFLAETELNKPGFAVADLDIEMLLACREQDDVRNWHDRHASDWHIEPAP